MDTVTASGDTSSYGFACGQVQSKIVAGESYGGFTKHVYVELYQEHGVYHVNRVAYGSRTNWETFDTLGEARKYYRSIKA